MFSNALELFATKNVQAWSGGLQYNGCGMASSVPRAWYIINISRYRAVCMICAIVFATLRFVMRLAEGIESLLPPVVYLRSTLTATVQRTPAGCGTISLTHLSSRMHEQR